MEEDCGFLAMKPYRLLGAQSLHRRERIDFEDAILLSYACLCRRSGEVQLSEKYGVKYADSYLSLARLCEKRGAVKEADGLYKKATKLDGSLEAWRAYAAFLDSQKRTAESAEARKKVVELEQAHKQFLRRLAK